MQSSSSFPSWLINRTLTPEHSWQLIPTKPLLPCLVPPALKQFASLWQVTGGSQPMVKAAVAEGCFLTKEYLIKLKAHLGYALPKKASGKYTYLKIDYCQALVNFLWPEAKEDAKERMVKHMMGSVKHTVRCPEEVLAAVDELAKNEQRDFEHLRDAALNQRKIQTEARKERADAGVPAAGERKTFTPSTLQQLLPEGVAGCFLNRNPLIKRYQAGYPGNLAAKCGQLKANEV